MIEAVRATSSYTGFLVKRSEHYCSNNLFSLDAIWIHLMLTPTVNQVPWECWYPFSCNSLVKRGTKSEIPRHKNSNRLAFSPQSRLASLANLSRGVPCVYHLPTQTPLNSVCKKLRWSYLGIIYFLKLSCSCVNYILDINECSINNGGCSHHCFNIPGTFYCGCPNGLTMGINNMTCVGKKWLMSVSFFFFFLKKCFSGHLSPADYFFQFFFFLQSTLWSPVT